MQNKIIQIVLICVGLLLALGVVTESVDLPEYFQWAVLISISLFAVLAATARTLAIDFKFLCLVLLGYALGGKGFAYVTPVEPVYIGEIAWLVCATGIAIRWFKGVPIFPTKLHWIIAGWLITVGLFLVYGFEEYRMVAIRDSTIGYYGAFFFFAYAIFQSEAAVRAFSATLKWCVGFGFVGSALILFGIYGKYLEDLTWLRFFFYPHPDAYIPLLVGGATYGIVQGLAKRSLMLLGIGFGGMILLLMAKTAGVFCLAGVMAVLLFFTRRVELLAAGLVSLTVAALAVGFLYAADAKFLSETVMRSDQVQTMSDLGTASGTGNTSTTDWRLTWWKSVARDTMQHDPLFGTGMGSDITSGFLLETFGPQALSGNQTYARYPHCILFTVFGRMGFVGLSLFLILFISLVGFGVKFASRYLGGQAVLSDGALIAFAVFFSGLMNSLVQATYEVPHAAIIHWVCLGYLVAYDQYHRRQRRSTPQPNVVMEGTATE